MEDQTHIKVKKLIFEENRYKPTQLWAWVPTASIGEVILLMKDNEGQSYGVVLDSKEWHKAKKDIDAVFAAAKNGEHK